MNAISQSNDNQLEERNNKKMKLGTMEEKATTLLEELRRQKLPEELRRKKLSIVFRGLPEAEGNHLVTEKLSQLSKGICGLPSKLQSTINSGVFLSESSTGTDTLADLERLIIVENAVQQFCVGRNPNNSYNPNPTPDSPNEWHGLDSNVDTEDQAELMIRLFPWVLLVDFYFLPSCSKAVSFLPLFYWLQQEFGCLSDLCLCLCVVQQLLDNTVARGYLGKEPSTDLHEESLAVLARFSGKDREKLRFDWDMIVVLSIFIYTTFAGSKKQNDIDWFERKLRLLIQWEPGVLEQSRREQRSMLGQFVAGRLNTHESLEFRTFEVIVEEGMARFNPALLGFVFHIYYDEKWKPPFYTFLRACQRFGAKKVTKVIQNNIIKQVEKTKHKNLALQSLVIAAAKEGKRRRFYSKEFSIGIDGLYTIIRCDPNALFSSRIPLSNSGPSSEKPIVGLVGFVTRLFRRRILSSRSRQQKCPLGVYFDSRYSRKQRLKYTAKKNVTNL